MRSFSKLIKLHIKLYKEIPEYMFKISEVFPKLEKLTVIINNQI